MNKRKRKSKFRQAMGCICGRFYANCLLIIGILMIIHQLYKTVVIHNKILLITQDFTLSEDDVKTTTNNKHSSNQHKTIIKKVSNKQGPCTEQYDWQRKPAPTVCNIFHEEDFVSSLLTTLTVHNKEMPKLKYLASGGWRDVWRILDNYDVNIQQQQHQQHMPIAMKTLLYKHNYTSSVYNRHRIDAIVNGRVGGTSQYIAPIYGACHNSALVQFAPGGSLRDIILDARPGYHDSDDTSQVYITKFNTTQKLILSYQIISSIHDIHYKGIDKTNKIQKQKLLPSIFYADIKYEQFVYFPEEGIFKLTDFNSCRMIPKNKTSGETCSAFFLGAKDKYRSPEEYKLEPQTFKADIYQLGYMVYGILTNRLPWNGAPRDEIMAKVIDGELPDLVKFRKHVEIEGSNSDDDDDAKKIKAEKIMLTLIDRCMALNPNDRSTSYELKKYLYTELLRLGILSSDQHDMDYVPSLL